MCSDARSIDRPTVDGITWPGVFSRLIDQPAVDGVVIAVQVQRQSTDVCSCVHNKEFTLEIISFDSFDSCHS